MERSHTGKLSGYYLKAVEQKETNTSNRNRRQVIIKLRAQIHQLEREGTIKKRREEERRSERREGGESKAGSDDSHL